MILLGATFQSLDISDDLVKNRKKPFLVIPAKPEIQLFQIAGLRLEFIPMKIGAGVTVLGLITSPSVVKNTGSNHGVAKGSIHGEASEGLCGDAAKEEIRFST